MAVEVRIPTILRSLTGEQKAVTAEGATLSAVIDDLDVLLGHLAVHDPVRPELDRALVIPVLTGADQDVMGAGLAREADVGAARVGLGGRVGVVDDDGFLVARPHVLVERQHLGGVELVERRAPGRVDHLDQALGPVAALGPGDDAARLVGVVLLGVRDDAVVRRLVDGQHFALKPR
jgi:hypothetical protein